jgi:hypothetical protein
MDEWDNLPGWLKVMGMVGGTIIFACLCGLVVGATVKGLFWILSWRTGTCE